MNELIDKTIDKTVSVYVHAFVKEVADQYELNSIELLKLWEEVKYTKQSSKLYKEIKNIKKRRENKVCAYIRKRGDAAGSFCPNSVVDGDDNKYCSTHKRMFEKNGGDSRKVQKAMVNADNIDEDIPKDETVESALNIASDKMMNSFNWNSDIEDVIDQLEL
jgi:putative heme iron utilization protein